MPEGCRYEGYDCSEQCLIAQWAQSQIDNYFAEEVKPGDMNKFDREKCQELRGRFYREAWDNGCADPTSTIAVEIPGEGDPYNNFDWSILAGGHK